jgi:hypothetical protein
MWNVSGSMNWIASVRLGKKWSLGSRGDGGKWSILAGVEEQELDLESDVTRMNKILISVVGMITRSIAECIMFTIVL